MKYPVFAVRDVKTCFYPPQVNQNEEDAIRGFAMMINNPSGVIGFAPKDFDLYKIGTFDTEKGVIDPLTPIEYVVAGSALVNEK